MLDYARKPLELHTSLGNRDVVNDQLIANINGAIGFTDWFEAGINVPIIGYETWADPDTIGTDVASFSGLGDVRLEMKFRILDIERYHFRHSRRSVRYISYRNIESSIEARFDDSRRLDERQVRL